MSADSVLRFDVFELDQAAGELRKRGRRVKLAPQPFRLLSLLASSPGQVITREAIRQRLWEGTFVDFEHGLNFCVREVRKALHDDADRPRFVETLPKRGYRFIAAVSGDDSGVDSSKPHADVPGKSAPVRISQLAATELYSQGRQLFQRMEIGALDEAKRYFEEAVRIEPQYAMAHSGLGAAYAMGSIHHFCSQDLNLAKSHLESAIDLDAELAEPYPWLCYVYIKAGDLGRAIDVGRRGVELLPDLVHAHYFLGLAYFVSCERGADNYQNAINHLVGAAEIEPRYPATWFVLASVCLLNGQYESAEKCSRLLLKYGTASGSPRFLGAENLLGTLYLRRYSLQRAQEFFHRSLEALSASDHAYARAMQAWSACGLGDVDLRLGHADFALAHYRKAWQIVQESPTIAGQERHCARALAGLAAGYAAAGRQDQAVKLLSRAESVLQHCLAPQASAAGANLADLHYAFGVAQLRAGNPDKAIDQVERALKAGWRDAEWLQRDDEWIELRNSRAFASLVEQICYQPSFDINLASVC